jgi:hypothetical protein
VVITTSRINVIADMVHVHALLLRMRRSILATLTLVIVMLHMSKNWDIKLYFIMTTILVGGIVAM